MVLGPFCHKWYCFLDRTFPVKTGRIILAKVFMDQLIAAPIQNLMSIIGCFDYAGKSIEDVAQFVKDKFLLVYTVLLFLSLRFQIIF